jgi:hypothetical protein
MLNSQSSAGAVSGIGPKAASVAGASLLVGFALLLSPDAAYACLYVTPPPVLKGIPAEGDVAVPTDVRPVYDMIAAHLYDPTAQEPQFELTDASGQPVGLTMHKAFVWHVELVPDVELKPLTVYTLRGHWKQADQPANIETLIVSFTTASGPLASAPLPPTASMQHYMFKGVTLSSCDPYPTGTCTSTPADAAVRVAFIDSSGQEFGGYSPDGQLIGYLMVGPFFGNLSGIDQGTNFECAKLSTRASNGTLSAPVVLCGRDAPLFELGGSTSIACTSQGLTHDGQLVSQGLSSDGGLSPNGVPLQSGLSGTDGSGCALAGDLPIPSTVVPLLVLAGLGIVRRRRKQSR